MDAYKSAFLSFRKFTSCIKAVSGSTQLQIRGVAVKFPEWFYCKPHTCILTAYWEGSPSKYFPSAAMYLPQQCCLPLLETFL